MDKKKILNLIKREEGTKLDFKQKLDLDVDSTRKELAKDICAIANSKGGRGYIIIGIEDKTKNIIGIDNSNAFTEEQIQQIVSSRCEPPIPISVDVLEMEDKKIAIITIYDSDHKPHQFRENGSFYIRRGSTTDTMRKQELISSFQENLNLNIETCAIAKSNINNLNYELVDKYFTSKGICINDDNRISMMENAYIITKDREASQYMVTLGGLLVFCKSNSVYIPQNMVRIVNKVNKDMCEILIISGDLLSMIDESERILKKILPEKYPYEAVFEGVKNAILYRDYSIYYKEIEVIIAENSISVISPGNLIKNSKVIAQYDNYFKRNMWLYEKLITLDDKNRFLRSGRGFSIIKKAFKSVGKVIFINSYENDTFKIIYPGIARFK